MELVVQFLLALALVITGGGFRATPVGMAFGAAFCFMPMFVREISSLFIEVTLCGFIVAASVLATSAVRWKSPELTIFAALCAAGAIATKTFGLILVPLLFALLVFNRAGFHRLAAEKKRGTLFLLFAAIILAIFFYAVAWLKTGNPLFPFYNGVFKSVYWDAANFVDGRWVGHLSWSLPWQMTFNSSIFEESASGSMGLGILLLAFGSVGLVSVSRVFYVAVIPFGIGVFYLVGVGSQIQYLRYLLPGFLLVAIGLVFPLRMLIRRPRRDFIFVVLGVLFAANLFGMPSGRFLNGIMHIPIGSRVVAGVWRGMPSMNFAEETLNGHRYVADILNSTARPLPSVLLLGCSYGAYFNGRVIYTNWINHSWAVKEPQLLNPVNFLQYIRDNKVSHIVLDGCTVSDRRASLIPVVKENFAQIAEWGGVQLFEVRR